MAAPTITTQPASGIGLRSATGNGNITATGGSNATRRGFQYNTVEYPDREVYEDGDFSTGAYTLTLTGLIPGQTYYYRAFATNPDGTDYGVWQSFIATAPTYNITIDGIDRTGDVINGSLRIEDVINDQQNTCRFQLVDRSGNGIPQTDEEIVITLNDSTIIFGGYLVSLKLSSKKQTGDVFAEYQAMDYARLLDSNLVHKTYEAMTDKEIIESIVSTYCPGFGITTNNVIEGVEISQISFNYLQASQCIRKIAEMTGRNWYIDYQKDIHYFPMNQETAPFNIDSDNGQYYDLNISKDATQLKNRVYVRGGTKLSEFTQYIELGNGEKRQILLPDKPHEVTVEVDRGGGYVEESVGIKNVNTSGFKWYLNYQEKYLDQDEAEAVLGSTDKMRVTYKYDVPILVAIENRDSIFEHGQKEFAIFDKSISTTEAARDRASAELTDYANQIIEGSFKTYEPGFVSGQYININLTEYGIDDDYIIQRVIAQAYGSGEYEYTVSIASAKTMGIIRFLIELLEANKNLIELDNNEVIDELFNVEDTLLSDSLIDSLTIDSHGPYYVWASDSLTGDIGTARFDLFQWG